MERVPTAIALDVLATEENFNEAGYMRANPDVAAAVADGTCESGRAHFQRFGAAEGRRLALGAAAIHAVKSQKLARVARLLRQDMQYVTSDDGFDFLTPELKQRSAIVDTEAVSGHGYDGYAEALVLRHADGLVLDCGAGRRPVYYSNVVNFEVVGYVTTDVRGVGEQLPFVDSAFDAVLSLSVLEHVVDPFACAQEIARVLKPGGELICCVPFLQPFHAYPHHYFNMTHQGLRRLFHTTIDVDSVDTYGSLLPISALTWIVRSWAEGLQGATREHFLNLRLSDLLPPGADFEREPYVSELSQEKNLELACATVLRGRRKASSKVRP